MRKWGSTDIYEAFKAVCPLDGTECPSAWWSVLADAEEEAGEYEQAEISREIAQSYNTL